MRLRNIKGASDIVNSSTYVIKNPSIYKGKWKSVFNNDNLIYVEIGVGRGKFIIDNAIVNNNINYIGIEKYPSVMIKAVKRLEKLKLNNIKLICMDALNIEDVFSKEIDMILLNFSDPWPKKKHHKRRLTSIMFLKKYDKIFKSNCHIKMKTDNIDLFNYSKEVLCNYGYKLIVVTNDLHRENIENITTEYEDRFVNRGMNINYLEGVKENETNS
ncbi:MAG: tRNA (guanosine(46)-N7)-methyltransferase TrmB [bacterium]|nr:tRNA (guanosine(46)-N7)-methyltransferase TrmB [bacterium]